MSNKEILQPFQNAFLKQPLVFTQVEVSIISIPYGPDPDTKKDTKKGYVLSSNLDNETLVPIKKPRAR
jgi:hypothetical protein